jgi:hypothetical protein
MGLGHRWRVIARPGATWWHQDVQRMHRGDILGVFAGRYVDNAAGPAIVC